MAHRVKLVVYHAQQCDPKKCTALKLKRHGVVRLVSRFKFYPKGALVLNPFSILAFSPTDGQRIERFGLVALDCSWKHAEKVLRNHVSGTSRCLPFLIAGNPVNFGKATTLSTVEALAAALYIAGFKEDALRLLSFFKWGHTFFDVNYQRLESYAQAKTRADIIKLQNNFLEELQI